MAAEKGNQYAKGCTTNGRPPHFKTPQELAEKCSEYFEDCITNKKKATVTGLTLFVGFSSRASWDDYEKRNDFSYTVKRAKLAVQNSYESSGTAFDIFALKNMGWSDKQEIDHTTRGEAINIPPVNWVSGE